MIFLLRSNSNKQFTKDFSYKIFVEKNETILNINTSINPPTSLKTSII